MYFFMYIQKKKARCLRVELEDRDCDKSRVHANTAYTV